MKGGKTRPLSWIPISEVEEFFRRIYNDLERLFPFIRQRHRYNIFFLGENKELINFELLKYRNDVLSVFKNYKFFKEKQSDCSDCPFIILRIDRDIKYKKEFQEYLEEQSTFNVDNRKKLI